ncbi:MAG: hypothetical protein DDT30_01876 [Dehalococcoidia bacterium]|nr:hypothetical protein [Bacillota bacterium]MBT9143874.1 hypothetical protein [Bacillota bacterium]
MRFEIVQGDEQLSSHSGLALVGAILGRTNIRERLDAVVLSEHPFPEISHGEVATAMTRLIPAFAGTSLCRQARLRCH